MTDPTPADLDIMTRTIDGEAENQPELGQIAVAYVIKTRAEWDPPEWWGHTISEVCKKPWQFSAWNPGPDCDRINALDPGSTRYQNLYNIAQLVLAGTVPDPTNGGTHYKVRGTRASWDAAVAGMVPVSIGAHDFYRLGPHG